jgi:hypothetical protein
MLQLSTTIRAELLARGITCGSSRDGAKELTRDGVSLGWFSANSARVRFLSDMVS